MTRFSMAQPGDSDRAISEFNIMMADSPVSRRQSSRRRWNCSIGRGTAVLAGCLALLAPELLSPDFGGMAGMSLQTATAQIPRVPSTADAMDGLPATDPTRPRQALPDVEAPLAAIRVEGNITIAEATILQKVKTRVGRPTTATAVREDVRRLYSTRWFFSVEPRYRRTEQGLELVFRVVERPIVQSVAYRGNEKVKDKHLAAQTGLKQGSPFDVSANREAARRLERFYKEKGYHFAEVALEQGGHHQDRDIIFRITEGPKVRVTSLKFTGNKDFSDALLKTKLQTKKAVLWLLGGKFDPQTITDDIAAVTEYYHSLGYFSVKIDHKLNWSADKAHVGIEYIVEEGPRFRVRRVEILGNEIFTTESIRADLELAEGEYFNSRTLRKDAQKLKGRYGELGHLFAGVDASPRFLEQPGEADLVYRIDEDRPYTVRLVNVKIRGENPRTRRTVVLNRGMVYPGDLADPALIERSKNRIVGSSLFERQGAEGPQVHIRKVGETSMAGTGPVRGQSPEEPTGLHDVDAILSGQYRDAPVTPASYRTAAPARPARGARTVPTAGHYRTIPDKPVPARPVARPRTAAPARPASYRQPAGPVGPTTLTLPAGGVQPRRQAVPRTVTGTATGRTRGQEAVVRGQTPEVRGQNQENGIQQPQDFLFDNSPQGDPFSQALRAAPGQVDLTYEVTEARTGRLMFGVGVNSDSGVVGSIVLDERNFDITRPPTSFNDFLNGTAWRGAGQRFRLEAVPGSEVSRYMMSWTDPYFLDTNFSLGLSGFFYNRFFEDWDEERAGGRITVGRQWSPEVSTSVAVRLEDVTVDNPSTLGAPLLNDALGSNLLSTVRVSASHDTRDMPFLPGAGHFIQAGYEQAFGDFSYPRIDASADQYFTVYSRPDGGGRHIISLSGNVGWTGDDTPIFERFYAGGFQTFRGFEFRGVSPRQAGVRVGGEFMALGTVQYTFPITANEMLQGVVFSDFGTVENEAGFDDFRATAGGGLRITVPAMGPVPLAFDWAVPLAKNDLDDTRMFSFYIGMNR